MKRITLEELNEKLSKSGAVRISMTKPSTSKTRAGVYIKIQVGLASMTYFFGYAHDEKQAVIEDVS